MVLAFCTSAKQFHPNTWKNCLLPRSRKVSLRITRNERIQLLTDCYGSVYTYVHCTHSAHGQMWFNLLLIWRNFIGKKNERSKTLETPWTLTMHAHYKNRHESNHTKTWIKKRLMIHFFYPCPCCWKDQVFTFSTMPNKPNKKTTNPLMLLID